MKIGNLLSISQASFNMCRGERRQLQDYVHGDAVVICTCIGSKLEWYSDSQIKYFDIGMYKGNMFESTCLLSYRPDYIFHGNRKHTYQNHTFFSSATEVDCRSDFFRFGSVGKDASFF